MSNTINPSGGMDLNALQYQRSMKTALHTGAMAAAGKAETKTKDPDDRMDGVKSFQRLPGGYSLTEFTDGSSEKKAMNGAVLNTDAEGGISVYLPNGMCVKKDDRGARAFDPSVEHHLPAQESEDGKDISFKDAKGSKWLFNLEDMSFQVENGSETLRQEVNPVGSVSVRTRTLSRDPVSGKFSQDAVRLFVTREGDTSYQSDTLTDVAANNKGLAFTTRGDVKEKIDFPYHIPQNMKGDCVSHDLDASQPQKPPQMPPIHPQDSFIPGAIGMDPWMSPGQMPGMPGMAMTPADPFGAVMTPSGLMRKREPDGSMFISLQNGILMTHMADGSCEAYDSRMPNTVFPVIASVENNHGQGPEICYRFRDAKGSIYSLYSNSADFAVTSHDGKVLQTVDPSGNMMINSVTYPPGQNGVPAPKSHRVLVGNNGTINTFGEKGVQVGDSNIVFAENGQITNYALPYEIPMGQSWQQYLPPVGYPAPGQLPVHDPSIPGNYPPPPFCQDMWGMPPVEAQMPVNPGVPNPATGQGNVPVSSSEPEYPPGYTPKETAKTETGAKTGEPESKPGPAEKSGVGKPVKPGIMERIKSFLTGDVDGSGKAGQTSSSRYENYFNDCSRGGHCNPYPSGYYRPNGGSGMGTALAAGALMGLAVAAPLLSTAMMWPCGMFYSPFDMWGYGMW
jgi:hypothetical protein